MTKRARIIFYTISIVLPVAMVFFALTLVKQNFEYNLGNVLIFSFLGLILAGFINIIFHELGHIIFGKINGFTLLSVTFFGIKITFNKHSKDLNFVGLNGALGATEMAPKRQKNIEKKILGMSLGGGIFNFILCVVAVIPYIFIKNLNESLFCFLSYVLPISLYSALNNLLPMEYSGARNDGAVIYGINKKDDVSKVIVSIQKIEAELQNGKSFREMDKSLFFDLPQLQEDNLYFISLLSLRYFYYLDVEDFINANKVLSRLNGLTEYMPSELQTALKAYNLHAYLTYDKNLDKGDELAIELERYLNKNTDIFNLLCKTAYILAYNGKTEEFERFYDKGVKDANNQKLAGLGAFYLKQLELLRK